MRLLLAVHGYPPSSCGGTETYVADLAQALARQPGVDVAVMAREGDPLRAELAVRTERRGAVDVHFINNTFQVCESFEDSYRNPALQEVASALIDEIAPDVAHIHHLTGLSTGLVDEFRRRAIPVVMTLNDYWLICHRGQLLDRDGRRCDAPCAGERDLPPEGGSHEFPSKSNSRGFRLPPSRAALRRTAVALAKAGQAEDLAGCGRCIPAAALAPAVAWRAGRGLRRIPVARTLVSLAERAVTAIDAGGRSRVATIARARHMRDVCAGANLLIAPSRTLEERYLAFGAPRERLIWCDQGIDVSLFNRRRGVEAGPLRLAFAGSLISSKAPHVLLDAVSRLPPGSATVDLIGATAPYHGDVEYSRALAARLGAPFIRHTGAVPHERVGEMLADVDLLVVPSVWIENAPFVIREAFAAGVPVVASRLGGMAEMVRDGVNGLLFEPGSPDALATVLRRVIDEPALLAALRAGIRPVMTIDEDAAQLVALYKAERLRPERDAESPAPRELQGRREQCAVECPRPEVSDRPFAVAAIVLNYRTPEQTWLAVRSLQPSPTIDRIIVVDNGSNDGSESELRRTLNDVDVLQTGANVGFPAGVNAGIRRALDAGAGAVLLVNSDVVLPPETAGLLSAALAGDSSIGIAAPVVLSRAEPDVIASAGIRFFAASGRMRHRAAGHRLAAAGPSGVHRVDAVSGCAMLIRREVFGRIGLFDEPCFFSFEDVDFCLRARAAGFETVCVTGAVAYHEGGATMGKRTPRRVYYGVRNHLRVAGRAAPRGAVASATRAAAIVAFNVAYVALSPEVPFLAGVAAVGRGTFDHLRGRYGG